MKKKRYIILMVIIVFFMINTSNSYALWGDDAENKKYYMTMAQYKTTINPSYVGEEGVDFYKSDMYPGGKKYHPWIIGQNIEGFHTPTGDRTGTAFEYATTAGKLADEFPILFLHKMTNGIGSSYLATNVSGDNSIIKRPEFEVENYNYTRIPEKKVDASFLHYNFVPHVMGTEGTDLYWNLNDTSMLRMTKNGTINRLYGSNEFETGLDYIFTSPFGDEYDLSNRNELLQAIDSMGGYAPLVATGKMFEDVAIYNRNATYEFMASIPSNVNSRRAPRVTETHNYIDKESITEKNKIHSKKDIDGELLNPNNSTNQLSIFQVGDKQALSLEPSYLTTKETPATDGQDSVNTKALITIGDIKTSENQLELNLKESNYSESGPLINFATTATNFLRDTFAKNQSEIGVIPTGYPFYFFGSTSYPVTLKDKITDKDGNLIKQVSIIGYSVKDRTGFNKWDILSAGIGNNHWQDQGISPAEFTIIADSFGTWNSIGYGLDLSLGGNALYPALSSKPRGYNLNKYDDYKDTMKMRLNVWKDIGRIGPSEYNQNYLDEIDKEQPNIEKIKYYETMAEQYMRYTPDIMLEYVRILLNDNTDILIHKNKKPVEFEEAIDYLKKFGNPNSPSNAKNYVSNLFSMNDDFIFSDSISITEILLMNNSLKEIFTEIFYRTVAIRMPLTEISSSYGQIGSNGYYAGTMRIPMYKPEKDLYIPNTSKVFKEIQRTVPKEQVYIADYWIPKESITDGMKGKLRTKDIVDAVEIFPYKEDLNYDTSEFAKTKVDSLTGKIELNKPYVLRGYLGYTPYYNEITGDYSTFADIKLQLDIGYVKKDFNKDIEGDIVFEDLSFIVNDYEFQDKPIGKTRMVFFEEKSHYQYETVIKITEDGIYHLKMNDKAGFFGWHKEGTSKYSSEWEKISDTSIEVEDKLNQDLNDISGWFFIPKIKNEFNYYNGTNDKISYLKNKYDELASASDEQVKRLMKDNNKLYNDEGFKIYSISDKADIEFRNVKIFGKADDTDTELTKELTDNVNFDGPIVLGETKEGEELRVTAELSRPASPSFPDDTQPIQRISELSPEVMIQFNKIATSEGDETNVWIGAKQMPTITGFTIDETSEFYTKYTEQGYTTSTIDKDLNPTEFNFINNGKFESGITILYEYDYSLSDWDSLLSNGNYDITNTLPYSERQLMSYVGFNFKLDTNNQASLDLINNNLENDSAKAALATKPLNEKDLRIKSAKIYDENDTLVESLDSSNLNTILNLSSAKNYYVVYEVEYLSPNGEPSTTSFSGETDISYNSAKKLQPVNPKDSRILNDGEIINFGNSSYWSSGNWNPSSTVLTSLENKNWSSTDYDEISRKDSFEIIGKQVPYDSGKITFNLPSGDNNGTINEFDSSEITFTFDNSLDYGIALGYLYGSSTYYDELNDDGFSYGYDKFSMSSASIEAKVELLSGSDNWYPEITWDIITDASGNKTTIRTTATDEITDTNKEVFVKLNHSLLSGSDGYLEISAKIERIDADLANNHTDTAMTDGSGFEGGSVSDTNTKVYMDMVDYFVKNFEVTPESIYTDQWRDYNFSFSADVGFTAGGTSFQDLRETYSEEVHVGWAIGSTYNIDWEDGLFLNPFDTEKVSAYASSPISMGPGSSKDFYIAINGGGQYRMNTGSIPRIYELNYDNNSDKQVVSVTDPGRECTLQCGGGNIDNYNEWTQEINWRDVSGGHRETYERTRCKRDRDGNRDCYDYTVTRCEDRTYTDYSQNINFWERYEVSMDIRETNTGSWRSMLSGTPRIKAGRYFELRVLGHYSTNRYSSMIWGRRTSGNCGSGSEYPDPTRVYSDVYACMRLSGPWSSLVPNVKDPNYSDVVYYPTSSWGSSYSRYNQYDLYTGLDPAGKDRHAFKSDVSMPDSTFSISFKNQPFRGTGRYDSSKSDDDLLQECVTGEFQIKDPVEYIHEVIE